MFLFLLLNSHRKIHTVISAFLDIFSDRKLHNYLQMYLVFLDRRKQEENFNDFFNNDKNSY